MPKLTAEHESALKFVLADDRTLEALVALSDDIREQFTISMTVKTNDEELADVLRYKGARKCVDSFISRLKQYNLMSKT